MTVCVIVTALLIFISFLAFCTASEIPRARINENGDESTLVIDGVEVDDSGDYFCEAHNQAGSAMSTKVKIKVRGKMEFVVLLEFI